MIILVQINVNLDKILVAIYMAIVAIFKVEVIVDSDEVIGVDYLVRVEQDLIIKMVPVLQGL